MTKVKSKQEIVDWLKESEKDLDKLKKMLWEDNAKRKDMKEFICVYNLKTIMDLKQWNICFVKT